MSGAHGNGSRKTGSSAGRSARSRVRLVPLVTAGVLLFGAAYQTAFARSQGPTALQQVYPPNNNPGKGSGLGTGEMVVIGLGGAAAVGGALWILGVFDRKDNGEEAAKVVRLPTDAKLRLVADREELAPGTSCAVRLEALDNTGQWQSVTASRASDIRVRGESRSLLLQKGTRNVFCVPITVDRQSIGKTVTLVGAYSPEGRQPLTTQLQVKIGPAAE